MESEIAIGRGTDLGLDLGFPGFEIPQLVSDGTGVAIPVGDEGEATRDAALDIAEFPLKATLSAMRF